MGKRGLGRPKKETSRFNRARVIDFLIDKFDSDSGTGRVAIELTAKEIQETFPEEFKDYKTAQKVLSDIARLFSLPCSIDFMTERILFAGDSYFQLSEHAHRDLKISVAQRVSQIIPAGSALLCSPGTTVALCVKALIDAGRFTTLITNNLGVVDLISRGELNAGLNTIFLTGGNYHKATHACVGDKTAEVFGNARASGALIGVSGINEKGELFVRFNEEVPVLLKIVETASDTIYIVADATKLGKDDAWQFASIPMIVQKRPNLKIFLVTNLVETVPQKDRKKSNDVLDAMKRWQGVKVVFAEEASNSK